MSETINIPRDTTVQQIANAVEMIAFAYSANLQNASTWKQISGLVKNGYAQKIFDYGD